MGRIFVLLTQLRNPTSRRVGFRVLDGRYCPLPDVPPEKTREVKLSRILRCCRDRGSPDWTIDVLVDGEFTGRQLKPLDLLNYTRIVFEYKRDAATGTFDVLCVEGVPENCSDFLLRLKYFGCMRNFIWDSRPRTQIARADTRVATKLREIEAYAQHFSPFVDATTVKRKFAYPERKKVGHDEKITQGTDEKYSAAPKNLNEHESKPHIATAVSKEKPTKKMSTTAAPPLPREGPRRLSSGGEERMSPRAVINHGNGESDNERGHNMDSFTHGILFLFAFTLACFVFMCVAR